MPRWSGFQRRSLTRRRPELLRPRTCPHSRGYAHPSWLIYGTGGFGFRGVTVTEPLAGLTAGQTLTGAVYGGGTELHRGNTIFFAEYLHSNFSNANATLANGDAYGIKGHSDAVRLGVKFKVGFDRYYDEVRDDLRK